MDCELILFQYLEAVSRSLEGYLASKQFLLFKKHLVSQVGKPRITVEPKLLVLCFLNVKKQYNLKVCYLLVSEDWWHDYFCFVRNYSPDCSLCTYEYHHDKSKWQSHRMVTLPSSPLSSGVRVHAWYITPKRDKGICSESRDLCKFWETSDSIYNCNGRLTGNRMSPIEWHRCQWPWRSLLLFETFITPVAHET